MPTSLPPGKKEFGKERIENGLGRRGYECWRSTRLAPQQLRSFETSERRQRNFFLSIAMLLNGSRLTYLCVSCTAFSTSGVRHISRNSAIHRGLRSEKRLAAASSRRRREPPRSSLSENAEPGRKRKRWEEREEHKVEKEEDEWAISPLGGFSSSDIRASVSKTKRKFPPSRLPFTTAASEFIYGRFPVIAALRAYRRKLYKLYIHPRANDEYGTATEIEQLAQKTDVNVVHVDDQWLPLMDRVAKDRPHNVRNSHSQPLTSTNRIQGPHHRSLPRPQAAHLLSRRRLPRNSHHRTQSHPPNPRRRRHQRRSHLPRHNIPPPQPHSPLRRLNHRPRQPRRRNPLRILPRHRSARPQHPQLRTPGSRRR
jgi:hypothetical protein